MKDLRNLTDYERDEQDAKSEDIRVRLFWLFVPLTMFVLLVLPQSWLTGTGAFYRFVAGAVLALAMIFMAGYGAPKRS